MSNVSVNNVLLTVLDYYIIIDFVLNITKSIILMSFWNFKTGLLFLATLVMISKLEEIPASFLRL